MMEKNSTLKFQGCGDGECIKLLSGADHCQCYDDAIKNENGTCSPNPGKKTKTRFFSEMTLTTIRV